MYRCYLQHMKDFILFLGHKLQEIEFSVFLPLYTMTFVTFYIVYILFIPCISSDHTFFNQQNAHIFLYHTTSSYNKILLYGIIKSVHFVG